MRKRSSPAYRLTMPTIIPEHRHVTNADMSGVACSFLLLYSQAEYTVSNILNTETFKRESPIATYFITLLLATIRVNYQEQEGHWSSETQPRSELQLLLKASHCWPRRRHLKTMRCRCQNHGGVLYCKPTNPNVQNIVLMYHIHGPPAHYSGVPKAWARKSSVGHRPGRSCDRRPCSPWKRKSNPRRASYSTA